MFKTFPPAAWWLLSIGCHEGPFSLLRGQSPDSSSSRRTTVHEFRRVFSSSEDAVDHQLAAESSSHAKLQYTATASDEGRLATHHATTV
ncbi:hypothetical protein TNCV_4494881 [Trichonephila clavipes]|nr:hypothetical protein TNCV_4494881 [Trichonephila clavipes]